MKIKNICILGTEHVSELTRIKTLKEKGLGCLASDLSRIMGIDFKISTGEGDYWCDGVVNRENNSNKGNKNNNPNNRRKFAHITSNNTLSAQSANRENIGVRIAVKFEDIEDFDLNKLEDLSLEYPMYAITGMTKVTIDNLFERKSKLILKTGRYYDICGIKYEEYEVFGIKFIKYQSKRNITFIDGTQLQLDRDNIGNYIPQEVYLCIDKIPFTIDKEVQLIYSDLILFVMILDHADRLFAQNSDLNKYLNSDFLKSINDELEHDEPKIIFGDEKVVSNRYGFNFDQITEEEIIEICIKCNIAVFLHGPTGTGKTERMVTLDRNLELVDFGCTSSDGFTGIIAKDFNSKELFLYEPYWYKNLCKKCEEEPDLIHILFLEELTSANKDDQKVAFEVTLNKTLTNSGFRLQLPSNSVVCAAGNEASQSSVATQLSAPLFGRFAHVYIDTNSEEWLKWAVNRKKKNKKLLYEPFEERDTIHPAILEYIKLRGDSALRTPYNGVTPNADPRKWALASKALYYSNNPNILRAFIGKELTADFIKLCKTNLVTLDDVINDRCTPEDVPTDPTIMYTTILCLSAVDDENFDKVRDFVSKLGNEYLATFDYEWSKDNDERIVRLYRDTYPGYQKRIGAYGNK